MPNKSILSISSHVVHGYVGNRATVFPLQYAGWDVDAINTTNYSNHPGYGTFAGSPASAELVEKILVGLKEILDFRKYYDLVLTGYTPNEKVLAVVYEQLVEVFTQQGGRAPIWIVDPVLGDNGRFYVSEKVVPEYHRFFSSGYVSLITPNQFEMEVLSGVKIVDWDSVRDACAAFTAKFKVANVVISSVTIAGKMYSVGYPEGGADFFYVPIAEIPCSFNGCGDLFVGLLANQFHEAGHKLTPQVLGAVLHRLHSILELSYKQELAVNAEAKVVRDLRIVQSRAYLLEAAPEQLEVEYLTK